MCGIAGIFATSTKRGSSPTVREGIHVAASTPSLTVGLLPQREAVPDAESLRAPLERMVRHLDHRGPDASGLEIINEGSHVVGLGHTRLAIIDLSAAGNQPMQDPVSGNWITLNGEIYNFRELRARLDTKDEPWRSASDTEVVLRAYRKWGKDCLEHLRGMFAFALWDRERRKLLLARDRLGIKPLYYFRTAEIFLFSSEVTALLDSGLVPRKLDPIALGEYLGYQSVPAPRTMIENVRTLLPGCWMTLDAGGTIDEGSYWGLLENASPEARVASFSESKRIVRGILEDAVALHMVSDVPVGAFLSGGIDSSAIVALLHEAGERPHTFNVGFDESAYDENVYARQIAERFCTEHTEVRLTGRALLDQVPAALAAMDQPTGDGINTYMVSGAVRGAGIKAAMSGLGGDEFFAGYPSFKRLPGALKYARRFRRAPAVLRGWAASTVKTLGNSSVRAGKAAQMIEVDNTLASLFPITRQILSDEQRRLLVNETWQSIAASPDSYTNLLEGKFKDATLETLSLISYAEGRTYMHDVLLRDTDQMSMAHALEVRVPLLDHKLVEYLMGLPDEAKVSNGTPKRLLVESLDGLLPDEIVHRPKRGFTLPFDPWMRADLRAYCEERLNPDRIAARGIFRPQQVQKLWLSFLNGSARVSWSRLWVIVVLEEWLERNGVPG